VAVLSGRVGVAHLELIEDAVQEALLTALETWKSSSPPENPSAWLYRVAFNRLIGDLRQRNLRLAILEKYACTEFPLSSADPEWLSENEITDDFLKMLFFCCDTELPMESQLVLSLKTLCGFDVREIAIRLFTTEENVYKRLARARSHLKSKMKMNPNESYITDSSRITGVQRVIYSLFSEGYLSTHLDFAIRNDLCQEAIRLAKILVQSPVGATPETAALLALMYFHEARSSSRVDGSGGLVLLEDQDRKLWNQEAIQIGLGWLELSARGDSYSRYHAEAAIAVEHCIAPSFPTTNWTKIIHHYDLLIAVEPSMLHELNRSVAVAEERGPGAALEMLANRLPPTWLGLSYLWSAVLADLYFRNGSIDLGMRYFLKAQDSAPSTAIKKLLKRRFASYSDEINFKSPHDSQDKKIDSTS
jgi:RNA polymerase sigma factor (sigma-70 family)